MFISIPNVIYILSRKDFSKVEDFNSYIAFFIKDKSEEQNLQFFIGEQGYEYSMYSKYRNTVNYEHD